jgi:hypothetical protein
MWVIYAAGFNFTSMSLFISQLFDYQMAVDIQLKHLMVSLVGSVLWFNIWIGQYHA